MVVRSSLELLVSLCESSEIFCQIGTLGERNSLIIFLILLCLHNLWIKTIEHKNLSSALLSPGKSLWYFSQTLVLRSFTMFFIVVGLFQRVLTILSCNLDILGMEAEDSSLISVIFFQSIFLSNKFQQVVWLYYSFVIFCFPFGYLLDVSTFLRSLGFSGKPVYLIVGFFIPFSSLGRGLGCLRHLGLMEDPLLEKGDMSFSSNLLRHSFLGVIILLVLAVGLSSPIQTWSSMVVCVFYLVVTIVLSMSMIGLPITIFLPAFLIGALTFFLGFISLAYRIQLLTSIDRVLNQSNRHRLAQLYMHSDKQGKGKEGKGGLAIQFIGVTVMDRMRCVCMIIGELWAIRLVYQ